MHISDDYFAVARSFSFVCVCFEYIFDNMDNSVLFKW